MLYPFAFFGLTTIKRFTYILQIRGIVHAGCILLSSVVVFEWTVSSIYSGLELPHNHMDNRTIHSLLCNETSMSPHKYTKSKMFQIATINFKFGLMLYLVIFDAELRAWCLYGGNNVYNLQLITIIVWYMSHSTLRQCQWSYSEILINMPCRSIWNYGITNRKGESKTSPSVKDKWYFIKFAPYISMLLHWYAAHLSHAPLAVQFAAVTPFMIFEIVLQYFDCFKLLPYLFCQRVIESNFPS